MGNSNEKIKFKAIIEKHPGIDGAYIRFPYIVAQMYGVNGQVKVKALFDNRVEYRGSLAKMGFDCHILGITQEIRQKINKSFGEKIDIEIEQDKEDRVVTVPWDVKILLDSNPEAKEFYNKLSFTNKKEYISWIESSKKEETRNRRKESFIEKLVNRNKFNDK